RGVNLVAHIERGRTLEAELLEEFESLTESLGVALLRERRVLFFARADLHRIVTVLILGADLRHDARADGEKSDRNNVAVVAEALTHLELLREDELHMLPSVVLRIRQGHGGLAVFNTKS